MVQALYSQSRVTEFKTTRWLQSRLSLSSFRGPSNEYQEFLSPRSGSGVLRQLNPTHKKGAMIFFLKKKITQTTSVTSLSSSEVNSLNIYQRLKISKLCDTLLNFLPICLPTHKSLTY